ncbi:lysophospholipase L1-like esterase [Dyadobacter jejuensis]|uniref:Lysophospholipase L1-like esterase n=1 Tax=Dyadobacter jejuensis TaxID=1082580 RepID=A0A316ASD1_9BACT|nr:GDSL-type esterase/lipase family protein [Dyadobacter jejuensis]PWJ60246.1 lysophospholipase L1-like esterase [Dyadobacter jejuensis]
MVWYEEEVKRIEGLQETFDYLPETVFYGSSSITLWSSLYTDMASLKPINLGFGGSTLAACSWYFQRVIEPVKSMQRLVLYAGDNDLGDGRNPEEVYLFYSQLIYHLREKFGDIPCYFISIKPSFQRWEIIGRIKTANRLIRQETTKDPHQHFIDIYPDMLNDQGVPSRKLFEPDGLHISAEGYVIWKKAVQEAILEAESLQHVI